MMKAWMRVLGVILTSSKSKLRVSYGFNEIDNLNIEVSGTKYLSALKDNFTVRIDNLRYIDVITLTNNSFDMIDIYAGYKSATSRCVYSGSILTVSNEVIDATTNSMIFICASKAIGLFKNRINLSLTSNLNMYTALKIICKQAGINAYISPQLKGKIINSTISASGSVTNIIDTLCRPYEDISINSDASFDSTTLLSIWNSKTTNLRVIPITPETIVVANGRPTLSSSGLTLYLLPTINLMPGDVIQLDNSYINIVQSSKDEYLSDPYVGRWLDTKGEYMIYEISYNLSNRGQAFNLRLLCKKRHLVDDLQGGSK